MSQENADNKANQATPVAPADNKATEERNPNLPGVATEQPKVTEPQDPELSKWVEETKDLPNAYKRVKGAEAEVQRYRQEVEASKKEKEAYQQQIAEELRALYDRDPDAAEKLFGVKGPSKPSPTDNKAPAVDAGEIARQVQAQMEVSRFYENNQKHLANDDDWGQTQELALGFLGKKDQNGKPYTIQSALSGALLIRHPNLIADRAVMDHLTAQAKRASASEPGDVPSGSGSSDPELEEEYSSVAQEMGVKLTPERRKRIAERKRKRQASR